MRIVHGLVLILDVATRVPSNCRFFVEDCNLDWNTFDMQKFDLIHTRAITPAIKDWSRYLKQAYECVQLDRVLITL